MPDAPGDHAALVRYLRSGIGTGTWGPGDRLPTERVLAERFGLARNTLRRRLDTLEEEGLIVRVVGSGTYVAERPPAGAAAVRDASPAEIMEFRLLLEPQVVDLVVARATSDDFAAMERWLEAGERAETVAAFEEADGALHLAIVAAGRNRVASEVYAAANEVRRRADWGTLKERTLTPERRTLYRRQHRAIVEALRDRDAPAARAALRGHLLAVRESLLG